MKRARNRPTPKQIQAAIAAQAPLDTQVMEIHATKRVSTDGKCGATVTIETFGNGIHGTDGTDEGKGSAG